MGDIQVLKQFINFKTKKMKFFKNNSTILVLSIITSILLASCTPPAPPPSAVSEFTYIGTSYDLDDACITTKPNGYYIILHSSGLVLNATTDGFTGTGDGVAFFINTSSSIVGTYSYNYNALNNGQFNDCDFVVGFDAATETSTVQGEFSGGTITISEPSPGVYSITSSGLVHEGESPARLGNINYEGGLVPANFS